MCLFEEFCPTCGLGDQGSRIEGRPESGEPPDPEVIQPARLAATPGVIEQKSADGMVAKRPSQWVGQGEGRNLRQREPDGPQRLYCTRPGEPVLAVRAVASVGGSHCGDPLNSEGNAACGPACGALWGLGARNPRLPD
jgi:hypothetical protein